MTRRQRARGDCGIVSLSVTLGLPYDVVAAAVERVDPTWRGLKGLHNREVLAAAANVGVTLTPTATYDLATARGVLRVRWMEGRRGGHFVALRRRLVFCPADARNYTPEEYVALFGARFCTLLAL